MFSHYTVATGVNFSIQNIDMTMKSLVNHVINRA